MYARIPDTGYSQETALPGIMCTGERNNQSTQITVRVNYISDLNGGILSTRNFPVGKSILLPTTVQEPAL
jgi:hypothetical protein